MKSHQGEKGLPGRLTVLALLMLAMLLASCGGGGGLTADAGSSLNNSNYPASQPAASVGGELLPLGSPLPALPDEAGQAAEGSRSTSAVHQYDGSDFLIASGGTVEGTSLLLESSNSDAAWAMYKASGLQGEFARSLVVETRPQDLDTTYYVAVGSFTDDRWHWLGETSLPEVNIDLTGGDHKWISELGNLYWVVLVDDAKSLHVDRSTILTGDGNGGGPPGGGCVAIGPIDSIDDLSIIVGNHYFIHTPDTLWLDVFGEMVGPDAFRPGMHVLVEGYEADEPIIGGGCVATLVQMLDPNGGGGGDFFAIDGPVAEINAEFMMIDGTAGFAPQMILHDEQTLFVLPDGQPAVWTDLAVGDFVHAEGDILDSGEWLARFVMVFDDNGGGGGEGFVLDGEVTAIGPETITVAEGPAGAPATVGHDEHTLFLLPDGNEGGWQDVSVGDFVHIDGHVTADGAWIADVVMDFGDGNGGGGGGGEFLTIDGEFKSANESTFEVIGLNTDEAWTISHDEATLWLLPDGPGNWDDVVPGSLVIVDCQVLDDNSLYAVSVFVHGGPPAGG